ncbi:MAG: LuxR C-terminal-related transcriptional regulator [Thermoleophilia bacterium]
MPQAPVRVLIASRSPAWSAGIASFLTVPPLEPGCAYTVDAALARLDAAPVALVVIDHALADAPGAELAAEVRHHHPGTRMVFALPDDGAEAQLSALAAGASGCLLPTWTREAVVEALLDALGVAGAPARPSRRGARPDTLTEQERVVLRLMRQRLTYKEIAQRLGVSWHTVRTHAQSILRKSGVHSRRDLDAWDARLEEASPLPAGGTAGRP